MFPDGDMSEYLDTYKSLVLPGTKKLRREGSAPIRVGQDSRDRLTALAREIDAQYWAPWILQKDHGLSPLSCLSLYGRLNELYFGNTTNIVAHTQYRK